jgi:hypothetical protein
MAAIAADYGVQLRLDLVERMPRGAFGYSPERWPSAKMFGVPVTPLQVKMIGIKAGERGVPSGDLPRLRSFVLDAYGVGDGNSMGNAALFIDWLMNADDDAIFEASHASDYEEPLEQEDALQGSLFCIDAA